MSRALPIADAFCADVTESAHEPLGGTAAHAHAWILVEEPGVWDRDPIASAGLVHERALIEGWLSAIPKSRLQLLRHPRASARSTASGSEASVAGESGTARRVMLALPAQGRVLAWTTSSLATVPMSEAARGESVLAEVIERPIHLVCTHGKRDRCCALRGMPIFHALQAAGADVWQTSHLGGHRFAATSLRLPDGYAFGYLTTAHVPSLLHETLPLELVRGRVCYDEPTQSAELVLRRALDARHPEDVAHLGTERTDRGWRARFIAHDREHTLVVEKTKLEGTRPKSCGDEPSAIDTFVATFDGPVPGAFDHGALDDGALDHGALDDAVFDDRTLDDVALDDVALDDVALDDGTADRDTLDDVALDDGPLDRDTDRDTDPA